MKKYFLASSLLLASTVSSFAGAFQLNLQGLRQLAMGGTGVAYQWDAATIYYNPAGLSRLNRIQVYGSVLNIMPATAYGNALTQTNTQAIKQSFTPFSIYFGGPVSQDSKLALGLGIYTPFGSGLKWDDNWVGRYLIQSIDLKCVFFQPTISYKMSEAFSIGGGFVYAAGSIDLRQALPVHSNAGPFAPPIGDEGQANLHGAANGIGFNVGIQAKLSEYVSLGATFRSQVNMNVDGGSAKFTVPTSLRDSFPNTTFDSQLPLPGAVTLGIAWKPTENLTLQCDINYTMWSAYDSLRINFKNHTSSLEDMHAPRRYKNVITPRIGACYKISETVSLMAGFAYDPTPVQNGFVSPDLPDADRFVGTCGITIRPVPRFTIIAAFEGVTSNKRNGSYDFGGFSGTYKTQAATPGIALSYRF